MVILYLFQSGSTDLKKPSIRLLALLTQGSTDLRNGIAEDKAGNVHFSGTTDFHNTKKLFSFGKLSLQLEKVCGHVNKPVGLFNNNKFRFPDRKFIEIGWIFLSVLQMHTSSKFDHICDYSLTMQKL